MRKMIILALATGLLGVSCGGDDDESGGEASVTLAPKSDNTTLAGTGKFAGNAGSVTLTLNVTGAPAGEHGVHIHETGDCSAPDGSSAGGHWNPAMEHMHGSPGATSHIGDLGNLTVSAQGTGTLTYSNPAWEIGTGTAQDVKGKAIIVHAMVDDYMTQPTGNSGGRIGCGVVE
ncbi:MAG: superoxide dismutase family protein [Polyangiales bacterium]